jgi:hypothetical protein
MEQTSAEQKKRIREFVPAYTAYCKSDQAAKDMQARQGRLALFTPLTKDRILQMDETDILALIAQLWATQFWKNQQYILDKIISSNGLEKLRKELADLLCGQSAVPDRYNRGYGDACIQGTGSMRHLERQGPQSVDGSRFRGQSAFEEIPHHRGGVGPVQ